MLAMIPETNQTGHRWGGAFPGTSFAASLGAVVAFVAVALVTRHQGGNPVGMLVAGGVMALATLLLIPPPTRLWALLLTWNGLGIGTALLIIGIFSVGALIAFPLVLVALSLSSWPRVEGASIISAPAMVVNVCGFLLMPVMYGMLGDIVTDLRQWLGW